jgi:hypothetical protein
VIGQSGKPPDLSRFDPIRDDARNDRIDPITPGETASGMRVPGRD